MADLLLGLQFQEQLPPVVKDELEQIMAAIQTWATDTVNAITSITNTKNPIVPPPGTIAGFGSVTAPSGWLLCNGATISRADYANLFTAIGTAFGAGDGVSTFRLPDLRGRFPLGRAASGTGSTFAGTGGALDHTHTGPSHTHTISADGGHSHDVQGNSDNGGTVLTGTSASTTTVDNNLDGSTVAVSSSGHQHLGGSHTHASGTYDTDSQANHNHSGATGTAGTGATGTANPAFLAISYIIKT